MKNNELAKRQGGYISPSTEAITLMTECRLLDGSQQGGLQDVLVNDLIGDEGV